MPPPKELIHISLRTFLRLKVIRPFVQLNTVCVRKSPGGLTLTVLFLNRWGDTYPFHILLALNRKALKAPRCFVA